MLYPLQEEFLMQVHCNWVSGQAVKPASNAALNLIRCGYLRYQLLNCMEKMSVQLMSIL